MPFVIHNELHVHVEQETLNSLSLVNGLKINSMQLYEVINNNVKFMFQERDDFNHHLSDVGLLIVCDSDGPSIPDELKKRISDFYKHKEMADGHVNLSISDIDLLIIDKD